MKRFASTRSEKRAEAAARPARAQWSVGSIEDDGIRYGLTTHALIASTIAIAPTIVTSQSMIDAPAGCGRHARHAVERDSSRARVRRRGSARAASRRSARGRPRGARRAPASRGTPPGACSAGTRARPRARPRRLSSSPEPSLQRAGQPPRDRVEQHHRRQVAAGEDVRPDRDRVGGEVLHDPLVEALEARREQRQPLLLAPAPRRLPASSWRPCGVSATTRCSGAPP